MVILEAVLNVAVIVPFPPQVFAVLVMVVVTLPEAAHFAFTSILKIISSGISSKKNIFFIVLRILIICYQLFFDYFFCDILSVFKQNFYHIVSRSKFIDAYRFTIQNFQ